MMLYRLIWVLLLLSPMIKAEEVTYQIKASYIYNFLQFIEFKDEDRFDGDYIKVCIVGENRFGQALNELQGANTPQAKIRVEALGPYSNKATLDNCHVLYIVGSEKEITPEILSLVDTRRTLTIGENTAFIQSGGFIELFTEEDSIRFRINRSLAGSTDFKVASQLLSLGLKGGPQ